MKVALIGCYSCNSLGDNMIAYAVKEALAKRVDCEVDADLDNLSRGYIDMTQFDLIILGGGTILGQLAVMPMAYAQQWLRKIRCPITMLGCGYRVGELRGVNFEALMSKIAIKGVRGPVTAGLLKSWGYKDVIVTGDTALLWDNYQKPHPPRHRIAINAGILELQYANFDDVMRFFVDITNWLEDEGNTVDFIPLQNEDLPVQDMIKKATKRQTANLITDLSVPAAAERLDNYDLLVGLHLHSFILSYITGTPALAMEYQFQKAHDFAQTVGLDDYIMDATHLDLDTAKSKISQLIGNDMIVNNAQEKMIEHRGKLEGVLDQSLDLAGAKKMYPVPAVGGRKREDSLKVGMLSTPFITVPPKNYGGLERVVYDLSHSLARGGHQVTVFAPNGSSVEGCEMIYWGEPIEKVHVNWLEAESKAVDMVADRVMRNGFDIVHGHNWFGFEYGLKAKMPELRVCHTHHGGLTMQWWGRSKPPWPLNLIALSKWMEKAYASVNFASRAVYNGIPIEDYVFHPEKGDRLLFVGRLDSFKRPHIAIEVARKTGLALDIVGGSFVSDVAYMESIKQVCDGKQIKLHLDASQQEKIELYQNAKAVIFPSNMGEPFGLIVPEANATGTAVIGSRDGAIPETIEDGVTGFICDNVDQMVEAVGKLDRIKPEACRERVERLFSREIMAENYVKAYRSILERREW